MLEKGERKHLSVHKAVVGLLSLMLLLLLLLLFKVSNLFIVKK